MVSAPGCITPLATENNTKEGKRQRKKAAKKALFLAALSKPVLSFIERAEGSNGRESKVFSPKILPAGLRNRW